MSDIIIVSSKQENLQEAMVDYLIMDEKCFIKEFSNQD